MPLAEVGVTPLCAIASHLFPAVLRCAQHTPHNSDVLSLPPPCHRPYAGATASNNMAYFAQMRAQAAAQKQGGGASAAAPKTVAPAVASKPSAADALKAAEQAAKQAAAVRMLPFSVVPGPYLARHHLV